MSESLKVGVHAIVANELHSCECEGCELPCPELQYRLEIPYLMQTSAATI